MNALTSQQRKLAYLVGILLLLIPIIFLGLPAGGKQAGPAGQDQTSGGSLAQLRQKYDLGESDLGNIDPSSVTMNLVLLGLRGIAVNQLWIQMDTAKDEKDWTKMLAATESIVKLQPHFEQVWDFNGWNLAWNTSVEWDAVPDRYYWVKQGGKFMLQGVDRNEKSTELRFRAATIFQKKIGIADESVLFRGYFLKDPDQSFNDGPDPDFNISPLGKGQYPPEGKDNYLVASDWYQAAVDNEQRWKVPLRKGSLDRTAFHSLPARCLFDYAQGLQKDGQFGEITREAWDAALKSWTDKFGGEELHSVWTDGRDVRYQLEWDLDDIRAATSIPEEQQRIANAIDSFQKIVNYRYWRTRGMAEAEPETAQAHRDFFDAGEAYKKQNWREAMPLVESAMKGFENMLARYPELRVEDNTIEEAMLAVQMWSNILKFEVLEEGESLPTEFPLRNVWQENQGRMPEIEREFRLRYLTVVGK